MWHGVVEVLAVLAAAAIVWTLAVILKAHVAYCSERAYPVPGLPLVGNTLGLARHGASFIHKCRLQVHAYPRGDALS